MNSSSSPRVMKQYQVFLSFRGEDTRRTIVSHLHKSLLDRGIETFKDDKRLEIGDSISDEIKAAIQNSKIAVVVISENYASSTWCLNELQMIMELHKKELLTVVPIFYNVAPSDVRHQRKTFSFESYKCATPFHFFPQKKTKAAEKVLKWREALTEISEISGMDSRACDNESMMVEDVAKRISRQLFSMEPIDLGDIVGMKAHMERLNPLLKLESTGEVRMVGIWGMGGVGKTTIAKFLYKIYSHRFSPHHCFIENVRSSTGNGDLLHLQEKLLSVVGEEHKKLWSVEQGCSLIKSRLRKRKIFLVIDDIDNADQLDALAKEISWFGPGSRIIITTRDKGLFHSSGIKFVYHVDILDSDNAIQVFKKFAFEEGRAPSDVYQRLAIHASSLAQGLPSALQVFGTYLRRMTSIDEWQQALGRLEKIPQKKIMDILRISYLGLDKNHKAMFLHVACLFNGDSVQSVKALVENGDLEIKGLVEKSLIDISTDGYITMHVLVEQAGKEFFREESDSQNQRILWEPEEIISVLQNNKLFSSAKSLALHMCEMPQVLHMVGRKFFRSGLMFLKVFRHVNSTESMLQFIPGTEELPQNVRLLHWDGYPLTTLTGCRLQNIVELNLRHSNLERLWGGNLKLGTLRKLDVTSSSNLRKPPDLSSARKLEELLMEGCTRLEQLPISICSLYYLKKLNLSHCHGLANLQIHISERAVPPEFSRQSRQSRQIIMHLPGEGDQLRSIADLSIEGIIHIQLLNLTGDAEHISYISKQHTPDESVPPRCYDFKSLNIKRTTYINDGTLFRCISLSDFPFLAELKLINLNILEIPDDIGQLQSLEKLYLSGNDFSHLPTSMKNLSKLKYLNLSNCIKLESLPELSQLQTLKISGCSNLRSLLELELELYLASQEQVRYRLLELGLENCKSIQSLSEQLGHFPSLIHLDLSRHDFEAIPENIKELSSLGTLFLNNCKKLKSVESLPPSLKHLYAHGCDSLYSLSLSSIHTIEHLDLSHCFNIKQNEHLILLDRYSETVSQRFICLPGNEVPSCFDNQSSGTSTKIAIPSSRFTHKLLGFAACIMIACESSSYLQFPALTYDWNCEDDGVIRINLKPTLNLLPKIEEEESVTLHHLIIINVPNCSNNEKFEELRVESHLQLPEEFQIPVPPCAIKACRIRMII